MKKILKLFSMIGISTIMVGCAIETVPFESKKLNQEAQGISLVRETPYGCKVLGEVEGKDGIPAGETIPFQIIYNHATFLQAEEGAMNDARNEAAKVVGNSKKRTVLRVIDRNIYCHGGQCPPNLSDNNIVKAVKVRAQVFECDRR
ncbi:hypothetical protein BKK51_03235 [Rodentibacter trehalosifermentans]|uniref:DUF4156 domain-containing protein n=1 Tax=Rodentibacter trehalosifermentans TaxID=1908263 RepID=A0A1V3IW64_9PAST|nr:hypothetical protein [Rodentibacter trehalosifermentans]OOF46191.1 hypothetical protein BKK51_03235 [Rodentibacter trehalosifermentans]